MWEETGIPGENPHRHGVDMPTPYRHWPRMETEVFFFLINTVRKWHWTQGCYGRTGCAQNTLTHRCWSTRFLAKYKDGQRKTFPSYKIMFLNLFQPCFLLGTDKNLGTPPYSETWENREGIHPASLFHVTWMMKFCFHFPKIHYIEYAFPNDFLHRILTDLLEEHPLELESYW